MQRRRILVVDRVNRDPFVFEVGQAVRLVALCCGVQHIQPVERLCERIRPVLYEKFNQLRVSKVACVVQSVELVPS